MAGPPARSRRSENHWLLSALAAGERVRLVGDLGDGAKPGRLESYRFVVPKISYRIPLPSRKYHVILETQGAGASPGAIKVEGEIPAAMQSSTVPRPSIATMVRVDDGLLDIEVGEDAATAPAVSAVEVQGVE